MRFTVTGTATCPRCKYSRTYSLKIDAANEEVAVQYFMDRHRYCFACLCFGIQGELNFDPCIQVQERLTGRLVPVETGRLRIEPLASLIP
jgi:hypothetical protein